jgi:hypothetical protein
MVCSAQFNNKVWALHVRARAEEHGRQSEIQPLGQPHPNTHVLCLCILGSAAPHRCVGAHCKPTVCMCTCLFRAALSRKKGAHVIVDGQCTRRHTVTELVTACCSGEVQAGTSLAEARRTCRYVLERRYKQNVRCHDLEQRATRVPSSTKLNRLHDLHHVPMLQCALSTGHCMPPCSTFQATSLSFVWQWPLHVDCAH